MRASYHKLMRLFYFLIPLLSLTAQSAPPDCDESDLIPGLDIVACTSLTINNDVTINPSSGLLRIFMTGLTGPVVINANINIDGGPGLPDVSTFSGGQGPGGPGAHDGGGNGFGGQEPGGFGMGPDGDTHMPIESPCSSGGGGAGFAVEGESGNKCATSSFPNNGGAQAITTEFDFTSSAFRGGFGGGAGGIGDDGAIGTGGGGGGALYIETSGTITIGPGVTISARGGNGGNANTLGGAGGAGSGGAVWFIGRAGIINHGTIDVSGGTKGFNYSTGAHGGNGSSGVYKLENGTIIIDGTNILGPANSVHSQNFKSDISCGTILPKNNDSKMLFQMLTGFFIVMMMSGLLKTLSRLPKKF